jgi:hypothetical protein
MTPSRSALAGRTRDGPAETACCAPAVGRTPSSRASCPSCSEPLLAVPHGVGALGGHRLPTTSTPRRQHGVPAGGLRSVQAFSPHLGRSGRPAVWRGPSCACASSGWLSHGLRSRRGSATRRRSTDSRPPGWAPLRRPGPLRAVIDWMHGGLRGVLRGFLAHRCCAREARRERRVVGDLFARCQRRAFRGFCTGAVTAPFTAPRYRPPSAEVTLAPWP